MAENLKKRRYCFTYNIEENETVNIPSWDQIKRYVYQVEKAPTTDQPHLQGYIELKVPVTIVTMKNQFLYNAHYEASRGSPQQNYDYCTKEASRYEGFEPQTFGDWTNPTQGKRSDLLEAVELIKNKRKFSEIAQEHPGTWVRYEKGLKSLDAMLNSVPRDSTWEAMDCRWYFGDPGTGKTLRVMKDFKEKGIYMKNPNNKWWDGYDPHIHNVILIDDYRNNKDLPYDELLRICQPYELRVELKGSTIHIQSTIIIITSNHPPWMLWPNTEVDPWKVKTVTPMTRRFDYWNFARNEQGELEIEKIEKDK